MISDFQPFPHMLRNGKKPFKACLSDAQNEKGVRASTPFTPGLIGTFACCRARTPGVAPRVGGGCLAEALTGGHNRKPENIS